MQLILDTQPKGGAAAGGLSREEVVDGIAEDLLARFPPVFDGAQGCLLRAGSSVGAAGGALYRAGDKAVRVGVGAACVLL